MAFLNGIFGNNNQQQQQNNQSQNNNNQQQQSPQKPNQQQSQNGNGSGGPAGSQQQPANSNFQGNQGGQGSGGQQSSPNPMDAFMNLLRPSEDAQRQQQQQQQQTNQGLFGDAFNAENINKAVGGTNFMQSVDPEKMKAALSGDVNAFMEVINSAVAGGVSTALQGSRGMVEHGVKAGTERFSSSLDSRFRNYQLKNHNSQNAALQHPIGKALFDTISRQIATNQPNMSSEQVASQAENMFAEFFKMGNPQQSSDANNQQSKGTDWSTFLDSPTQ